MHFAQTLDAGQIPEWRSRYINYEQGKKLIKKLEKSLGDQLGNWNLPPPAQSFADLSGQPNAPQNAPQNAGTQATQDPDRPKKAYNSIRSRANDNLKSHRFLNERSPLLDTPLGRLYTTPQEVTASGSIPMQPLSDDEEEVQGRTEARKRFFTWLNAEVARANEFYAAMEKESRLKLKLIEVQVEHFTEHRKIHQQERAAHGVPTKASWIFDSLDYPTLPEIFRGLTFSKHRHTKKKRAVTRGTAHTSDFNNRDDHVGYFQAKSMLRTAIQDFYQSLIHLKEFRQLNETAIRKIVKKFDKQLHFRTLDKYLDETSHMELRSSSELQNMVTECEHMYAVQFLRGNHKLAVDTLSLGAFKDSENYEASVLLTGFFVGAAIPLIVLGIWGMRHVAYPMHPDEVRYTIQMWGGFALVGLIMLGFGGILWMWSAYRINYAFILELERSTMMDARQYPVLPSLYAFGVGLFGWLTYNTVQPMHRYYPALFLGLFCLVFAFPGGPYWLSRRWILHSLWRLTFSGLYSVEFRDLLMGDIMCSLSYSLSTMELFFCVYGTPHWWSGQGAVHARRCTSQYSRAMGFLNTLPGIWRFLQCCRRYADTLDWFPHLLNAGKYLFTVLYYMSLSLARISPQDSGLKAMFIVFALLNGVFTGIWDVLIDFSLSPTSTLRGVLVFPKWLYWFTMIVDPLLRQNWILYVVFWEHKQEGALISFIVALIEALRRLLWILVRVENEHAANIARCRAFKDLNLPYDDMEEIAKINSNDSESQMPQNMPHGVPHGVAGGTSHGVVGGSSHGTPYGTPNVHPVPIGGASSNNASRVSSPALRRISDALSPLSPRINFAHTNDFERRKPDPVRDAPDASSDEEEEEDTN